MKLRVNILVRIVAPVLVLALALVSQPLLADGVLASGAAQAEPQPTLTLSPGSGFPGAAMTIFGSNFPATARLEVLSVGGKSVLFGEGVFVDGEGNFATTVTVPDLPPGAAKVAAIAKAQSASAEFLVLGPPAVTVTPNFGLVGTPVTIRGTGFGGGDFPPEVKVVSGGRVWAAGTADFGGSFVFEAKVPALAQGKVSVVATDELGNKAETVFTVTAPAITLRTTSGVAGSNLTIAGSDYPAFARLTSLTIDGVSVLPVSGVSADGSGKFFATVLVPNVPPGRVKVVAANAEVAATAIFTVLGTPILELGAPSGAPGSELTIFGSNFPPSLTVSSLTIGGVPVHSFTRARTDLRGGFTATVIVPGVAPGRTNVTAVVGRETATARFIVFALAKIRLDPVRGLAGSAVFVGGSGFGRASVLVPSVTISMDGIEIGTAKTDFFGSFNVALMVPDLSPGMVGVTATGSSGNFATANFEVVAPVIPPVLTKAPVPTPIATNTPVPTPTATPRPTPQPVPTATPRPTLRPTAAALTATTPPTRRPQPTPTNTPVPTEAAAPTNTLPPPTVAPQVTLEPPDLALVDMAAEVDPDERVLALTVDFINLGETASPSSTVRLSALGVVEELAVPALASGETGRVEATLPYGEADEGQVFLMRAEIDPENSVREADEETGDSNNQISKEVQIPESTGFPAPAIVSGAAVAILVVGGGAVAVGLRTIQKRSWERKSEEKERQSGCTDGARYCHVGEPDVEAARRKVDGLSITRLKDGAEIDKIELGEGIFGPLNSVIDTFRITGQVPSNQCDEVAERTVSAFLNQAAEEDAEGELSVGAHLTGSNVKVTFTLHRCRGGQWEKEREWKGTVSDEGAEPVATLDAASVQKPETRRQAILQLSQACSSLAERADRLVGFKIKLEQSSN